MILSHEDVKRLARKIESSTQWVLKDLQALSEAVGMEKEWQNANYDDFETVAEVMIEKAKEEEE